MPTTLTGLLLFVTLLLPGFAYLVGKERAGTERRASPFRETVAVVAASVSSELAVVLALWPVWSRNLNIDRLVSDPDEYWQARPGILASWGVGLLLGATTIAYLATRPWVRQLAYLAKWPRVQRRAQRILGEYPHPSSVSSWWVIFEQWPQQIRQRYEWDGILIRAACYLNDGSMVEGTIADFNQMADETADRDLILVAPIERRGPDGERQKLKSYATSLSARDIRTLLVRYFPAPSLEPAPSPDAPEDVSGT